MEILITCEWYYPRIGGVERVVQTLAEGLVKKGVRVVVATTLTENQPKAHNGVEIQGFEISGNSVKGIKGQYAEIDRYKKLLLDSKFDLLFQYAAQSWHVDLALKYLSEISSKKILAPCGFSGLLGWKRTLLYSLYFIRLKSLLRLYDHFVVHAENYIDSNFLRSSGYNNVSVIPNGVDLSEFECVSRADARKSIGIIDGELMVLNVANHFRLKGHAKIIRAFQKANVPDSRLLILGGAPKSGRSCYSSCLRKSQRDRRIKLLDGKSRDEVIKAYKAADIFILASDTECYPLVILEALAAKIPVLTTKVGAIEDMVDGNFFSNEGQLTNLLLQFYREGISQGDREAEKQKSILSWDLVVDKYYNVFEKLTCMRS